jgi:hypothetical protein
MSQYDGKQTRYIEYLVKHINTSKYDVLSKLDIAQHSLGETHSFLAVKRLLKLFRETSRPSVRTNQLDKSRLDFNESFSEVCEPTNNKGQLTWRRTRLSVRISSGEDVNQNGTHT